MSTPSFADRLKQARAARGLTQSSLATAAKLNADMQVSRYERGEHVPRPDTIRALAIALDVDTDWLIAGVGRGPDAPASGQAA